MKQVKALIGTMLIMFVFHSAMVAQKEIKPRPSKKAAVTQRIGFDTDITISYSRPGVKGRVVWGEMVPYGLHPGNESSNNNPFPWRGGANECTTIEFSRDVLINGNKLAAGKYSLHFIPSETQWVVLFNKNNTLWGSFRYNQAEDALRIKVIPFKAPFQEWLLYGFDDLSDFETTAFLHWAELKVPFEIKCI